MVKVLKLYAQGAYMSGEYGHPQKIMDKLGITYTHATPQSIGDQWWFWLPENLPQVLPDYIELDNIDPNSCVGFGLSEANVDKILSDLIITSNFKKFDKGVKDGA